MFDVGNVGIHHEGDKVEYEVGTLPQDGEGRKAKVLESCVMDGLYAAHGIEHLLAYLDRRSERLGISSKDISKIDWMTTKVCCQQDYHRRQTLLTMEEVTCRASYIVSSDN